MIRKEGKARWTYTCEPCDETMTCVDQFRALEYAHSHERGYGHAGIVLSQAMNEAFNTLAAAVKPALDAFTAMGDLFAPPLNIPHDPALRRDKRKWGGR